MKRLTIVAFIALCAVGCAPTRQARLYDVESSAMLHASYRGYASGILTIVRLDQAVCAGEYRAIAHDQTIMYVSGVPIPTGGSMHGQAVATCADGMVFECDFTAGAGGGYGGCHDSQAHSYRLMF